MEEQRGRGRGKRGKRPPTLTSLTEGQVPSTPGNDARPNVLPAALQFSDPRASLPETRKRGRSPSLGTRGSTRGGRLESSRFEGAISVTKSLTLPTKKGTYGTPIDLITNYFPLRNKASFELTKYRIDFNPEVDNPKMKKRLLRNHAELLGPYIFDGVSLLFRMKSNELTATELSSPHPKDLSRPISIKIQEVGDVTPLDSGYNQVYNVIFRNCLHILNLENLGRHFYDMSSMIEVKEYQLNVAPGYITSIRKHEYEMLLCVDTTHKVIRTDNVLSNLQQIWDRSGDEEEYRRNATEELVGAVVITTYKNRTYTIADIDWDANPKYTFNWKGASVTLIQYYKTVYGVEVEDLDQPLLYAKCKLKDVHGGRDLDDDKPVYLIPELCNMTGLTSSMRSNFHLMKALASHLHQEPVKKLNSIRNLMRKVITNQQVQEYLGRWGLFFDRDLIQLQGRVLPGESIIFSAGNGNLKDALETVNDKADWTMSFRHHKMLSSAPLVKWTIIVPKRDADLARTLVSTMTRVAKPLGFTFPPPSKIIELAQHNITGYVSAIEGQKNEGNELVFIILASSSAQVYNAIKTRLTGELGQVSQCMQAKNLRSKAIMTIATKLVIQINAKLGGEPWAVNIPLKKMMVVGVDFHRAKSMSEGKNLVAMVASTSDSHATFFSTVTAYSSTDALSLAICSDLIKCVEAYEKVNGERPTRILLFRDGSSGDGDLERIIGYELRQILEVLHSNYASAGLSKPLLTFIHVCRKVNTRIFKSEANGPVNPPHGTVCDDTITLPERFDFFLVPQNARQGSVSPSAYNILYDDLNLGADKIQRLTYKMCHLYFNWTGTVAVPAPCQYARKLASLAGVSLSRLPTHHLNFKLHFL